MTVINRIRTESPSAVSSLFELYDQQPSLGDVAQTFQEGLRRKQKALPAWLLYDERGSELFEDICKTQDYYPTRTELGIMRENMAKIAKKLQGREILIEFGSGSAIKTELLLEHADDVRTYICIEISKEALTDSCTRLKQRFPKLHVVGICANYLELSALPHHVRDVKKKAVAYFPGSTIGNFTPDERMKFLRSVEDILQPNDGFLLGIDLQKPVDVLERAYDDSEGVTAAFNLNLIDRLNREFGCGLKKEHFQHRAIFNPAYQRIEMHLMSLQDQVIQLGDERFQLKTGETIHTESSHKFQREAFRQSMQTRGFKSEDHWSCPKDWFSIEYFAKQAEPRVVLS